LPEDGFFVDELTQVGYAAWSFFPTYTPRHFISSGYQGTLGYGFPTALGVKAANPKNAVVSISGDGGFLFAAQELATAAKFGLGVVSVVFNDGKFGNVQRIQKERYAGKVIGSDLTNPDFVRLAESFGVRAARCPDAGGLEEAIAAAIESDAPTVIEVPVGELPSPWPFIVLPQNRS
jgi:acetolactate synthase-1/2/3 large subunit